MSSENYPVTGMTGKLNLKEYLCEKKRETPPCEKCRYDPYGDELHGLRCEERQINHAGYYCTNFEKKKVKSRV